MLSSLWTRVRVYAETLWQYRAAVVTAEALVWHHGYKGLDAALKAAEAPTGGLREDIRAELVARFAADRYLRFSRPMWCSGRRCSSSGAAAEAR